MRFLSSNECQEWCKKAGYLINDCSKPTIASKFNSFDFRLPKDTGQKIFLTRLLCTKALPRENVLIWITAWGIWPSCEHPPLMAQLRKSYGEMQSLKQMPGQLFTADEVNDSLSFALVASLFFWDFYILTQSSKNIIFLSHDEFGQFFTDDLDTLQRNRGIVLEFLNKD